MIIIYSGSGKGSVRDTPFTHIRLSIVKYNPFSFYGAFT